MSRFYGTMQGSRGETTRTGTKASDLRAHVRGWDFGVRVCVYDDDGVDTALVYLTSGSNGAGRDRYIGTFTAKDLES